jgi:hypothetical protein
MATRIVTSAVARCPYCCWSKLVFGTTKWQVKLEAARETLRHTASFKIPTHDASGGQR